MVRRSQRHVGQVATMSDSDPVTAGIARWVNSGAVGLGTAKGFELLLAAHGIPSDAAEMLGVSFGAAWGSLAEGMTPAAATLWKRQARNLEQLDQECRAAGPFTLDGLIDDAVACPQRLEVLARLISTVAHALDESKIHMLARAYVEYVRIGHGDDALHDFAALVEAIGQLERPHMRAMAILSRDPATGLPDPDGAQHRGWSPDDFAGHDRKISDMLPMLIAKLQAVGFVEMVPPTSVDGVVTLQTEEHAWRLTESGRVAAQYMLDRGRKH